MTSLFIQSGPTARIDAACESPGLLSLPLFNLAVTVSSLVWTSAAVLPPGSPPHLNSMQGSPEAGFSGGPVAVLSVCLPAAATQLWLPPLVYN